MMNEVDDPCGLVAGVRKTESGRRKDDTGNAGDNVSVGKEQVQDCQREDNGRVEHADRCALN